MKKTFLYFAVIFAAMFAGISCEKIEQPVQVKDDSQEVIESELPEGGDYVVKFSLSMADDQTKTGFDSGTGIEWKKGDEIRFYQVYYETESATSTKIQYAQRKISKDGDWAEFECSFNKPTVSPNKPVRYYALYPSQNYVTNLNFNTGKRIPMMTLPETQNPSTLSFDPMADILLGKYLTVNQRQEQFKPECERMVAIGKMKIKNLQSTGEVSSVVFSAKTGSGADVVLAGSTYYNFNENSAGDGYVQHSYTSSATSQYNTSEQTAITLDYSSIESFSLSGESGGTAYFCCYPFELGAGDSFTVKIITKAGEVFEKVVTLTTEMVTNFKDGKFIFARGQATKFTVDMSSAEQDEATVTIGGTTTSHSTITDAFDYANDATGAATIKLMKHCTANTALTVNNENGITLDLNGHIATAQVDVSKNFTIQSSVAGGTITSDDSTIKVYDGVELTLESGTVESTCNGWSTSKSAIYARSSSSDSKINIIVNGGDIQGTGLSAVYLYNAKLTMSESYNGTFSGARVIVASTNAEATINAAQGTFISTGTADNDAIFHFGSALANITVSKGNFETNKYIVNTFNKGTLNITGGYFKTTGNELSVATNDENATNVSFEGGYFSKSPNGINFGENCGRIYNDDEMYVIKVGNVQNCDASCAETEGDIYAETINKALDKANASPAGLTVKLNNSCELKDAFEVAANKTVTIDLNGKTLTADGSSRLNIKSSNAKLVIDNTDIENEGVLEQNDNSKNAIRLDPAGSLQINGGTIKAANNASVAPIFAKGGEFEMNGGLIDGNVYRAIQLTDCSKITVTGGEATSNDYALYVSSGDYANSVMISGGKFISKEASAIFFYSSAARTSPNVVDISGNLVAISEGKFAALRLYRPSTVTSGTAFNIDVKGGWFSSHQDATYVITSSVQGWIKVYSGHFDRKLQDWCSNNLSTFTEGSFTNPDSPGIIYTHYYQPNN